MKTKRFSIAVMITVQATDIDDAHLQVCAALSSEQGKKLLIDQMEREGAIIREGATVPHYRYNETDAA